MSEQPGRARRWASLLLRFGVVGGLLGYVIHANRDQFQDVLSRSPNYGLLALAFVFYMMGVMLAFVRWYSLVRAAGLECRFRDAVRLSFIGLPFNLIIPGAVGGDVIKAAYFCREQGSKARPIASIVIDRFIGLLGLFILASVVGLFSWGRLDPSIRKLVLIALCIAIATAGLLISAFLPLDRLPIRFAEKFRVTLAGIGASYRNHLGSVFGAIAMSVVTHIWNVLAFYCTSKALYPVVPGLQEQFLIVPLVLFSTAIPLPFAALGASENISAALFKLTNFQGGAVSMMAIRILQLGGALIGLVVYLANQAQVKALRETAEHMDDTVPASPPPHPSADGLAVSLEDA